MKYKRTSDSTLGNKQPLVFLTMYPLNEYIFKDLRDQFLQSDPPASSYNQLLSILIILAPTTTPTYWISANRWLGLSSASTYLHNFFNFPKSSDSNSRKYFVSDISLELPPPINLIYRIVSLISASP